MLHAYSSSTYKSNFRSNSIHNTYVFESRVLLLSLDKRILEAKDLMILYFQTLMLSALQILSLLYRYPFRRIKLAQLEIKVLLKICCCCKLQLMVSKSRATFIMLKVLCLGQSSIVKGKLSLRWWWNWAFSSIGRHPKILSLIHVRSPSLAGISFITSCSNSLVHS